MDSDKAGGLAAGLLIGVAVGAGFGLLYAPKSGRKTRKEIQKQALGLKEHADEFISNVKERDAEFCKAIREGTENYRREMLAKMK
ncbi:YtxH domain-containing protein [Dehalogenimonas sp. THU2]|uniref:YtxH domain-containing protein n=1 Tax=Dehalogenimonas sp. THU2 TaxID=3151121 RepID=UPI0032182FDE